MNRIIKPAVLCLAVVLSFFLSSHRPENLSANRIANHSQIESFNQTTDANPPLVEARKSLAQNFAQIPLHFEANKGQTAEDVRFLSRAGNNALFLKPSAAVLKLRNGNKSGKYDALEMQFVGANENAAATGENPLAGTTNYYIGDNSEKWQTEVSTFERVRYNSIYAGVDLVFYGSQQHLEYDFVVAPNANPDNIKLKFNSAENIKIDRTTGDLILKTANQEIRQRKPVVYQEINGERTEIAANYKIENRKSKIENREVSFELGDYDRTKTLVIDPVIVFSTLLGGTSGDDLFNIESGFAVAVDAGGNIYLGGATPSTDFPVLNAQQPTANAGGEAFLTKLNPTGTALIYSTYFGGADVDRIFAVALDASGQAYTTGFTFSSNFPTQSPYQNVNRGNGDAFVAKFKANGSLDYSSYLGGTGGEIARFIKPDGANVIVTGETGSTDYPTANALQPLNAGGADLFITKLNITTNTLVFSTYLGGNNTEGATFASEAVDAAGNIFVAGVSNSSDFPVTPNAFQIEPNGSDDVVVAKISAAGNALLYGTYIGGNLIDNPGGLAVDARGDAVVTGFTRSSNYPLKNAAQTTLFDPDSFVTKINSTGTALIFSTFLGGSNLERGFAVATDANGNVYATGRTNSGNFPARRGLRPARGLDDAYVAKYNRNGALLFSTLLGGNGNDVGYGITADNSNNVVVTGIGTRNFFTTPGAFQRTLGGQADAFAARINTATRKTKADFDGDGRTDVAVFRPSNGTWYVLQSSNSTFRAQFFGTNFDVPVPGDYDADGKTDFAVYRPSESRWFILNSTDGAIRSIFWGSNGDKPVQADYDGDDKTDVAVYRPSNGVWYIINSSNNNVRTQPFGTGADRPVPADYDGDSIADVAVYTPMSGVWQTLGSFTGFNSLQFGTNGDKPVPSDFDGDGFDDFAVFRPSVGSWYYLRSASNNQFAAVQWGASTDTPSAGDFDGDGREDFAVFRPENGSWYVLRSATSSFYAVQFGTNGDVPISSAYIPQ